MVRTRNCRGFSLAEILIVLGIMAVLATVVILNFSGSDTKAKENALKANVALLREAVDMYRSDHGWYPCDPDRDWNKKGKTENFVYQLLGYTDVTGKPNKERTDQYKYGPYLKKWPVEPFSSSGDIVIDMKTERPLYVLAEAIAKGKGTGGWYYEAKSGNVCANLGKGYPEEYANY